MRQLIGKLPIKHRGVIEEVYFSEFVYCRECQKTVPLGIEVVTIQKEGKSKKILKRACLCRAHGGDYQARGRD